MGQWWLMLGTTLVFVFTGHSARQDGNDVSHRAEDLILDLSNDDYPESTGAHSIHKSSMYLSKNQDDIQNSREGLFEALTAQGRDQAEDKVAFELKKRITALSNDPATRIKEMIAGSRKIPDQFVIHEHEPMLRGLRFRPFFTRNDLMEGGPGHFFAAPGKKRPSYYAEPEGSEFLGGPGKR